MNKKHQNNISTTQNTQLQQHPRNHTIKLSLRMLYKSIYPPSLPLSLSLSLSLTQSLLLCTINTHADTDPSHTHTATETRDDRLGLLSLDIFLHTLERQDHSLICLLFVYVAVRTYFPAAAPEKLCGAGEKTAPSVDRRNSDVIFKTNAQRCTSFGFELT